MANSCALSSVMCALLGEQRADLWRINAAVYPPQFISYQIVTLTLERREYQYVCVNSADAFVVSLPQRKINLFNNLKF